MENSIADKLCKDIVIQGPILAHYISKLQWSENGNFLTCYRQSSKHSEKKKSIMCIFKSSQSHTIMQMFFLLVEQIVLLLVWRLLFSAIAFGVDCYVAVSVALK